MRLAANMTGGHIALLAILSFMAIGKSKVNLNLNKLLIKFGSFKIIENGQLSKTYKEEDVAGYMKSEKIDIIVDLNIGKKEFTSYTMDLTKEYIDINANYRT